MIDLSCDYNIGCAPELLSALSAANDTPQATYGFDAYSDRAKEKIRAAVGNPGADVYLLVGGTQTNATVLAAILRPWEGVLCAASAHIAVHESGAVEATGHKALTLPADAYGRLSPETLRAYLRGFYADPTYPHMVQPGAVYLSHPTELGGLYTAAALREIRALCDAYSLRLYVDGARLAYALASPDNDVTLPDLARLCDAFTIGGTKCGAAFGEALVLKNEATVPHFETLAKRRGALLAKGRMLGAQFLALFTNGLYTRIGQAGNRRAKTVLAELRMRELPCRYAPTNQVFFHVNRAQYDYLKERVLFSTWENRLDGLNDATLRLVTDWATEDADVEALCEVLREMP